MTRHSAPDPWFERRIRRGMAALMALRMDGHPPADMVESTARVWAQSLWPGRVWSEELDSPRIGEAFRQITLHETRWPTPAVFLRHLPMRIDQKALPSSVCDGASRRRAMTHLADVLTTLRGGVCITRE